MTKAIPSQVEEELSYLMNFGAYSQRTEGETRTRRRRRKPKLDGAGEEAKKRRLTDAQVKFLEMSFGKERKLESGRKVHLASELGLDPKQVAVWFQNRRARHKSKQIEQEYLKLKSAHDTIIVEKCHLENEVLKLKKKLSEAEESVRKLSGAANGASGGGGGGSGGGGGGGGESGGGESGGSPTSSFSTVTYHPLVGEFGVDGEVDLMYIPEYNFNNYMDWGNLYGIL